MKKQLYFIVAFMLLILSGCGQKKSAENYINSSFITENYQTVMYETKDHSIGWGKNQCEEADLNSDSIEIAAGNPSDSTKEMYENDVSEFKTKLDILDTPYALGYCGDRGNHIKIKISSEKVGLPVFELLNNDSGSSNVIVSGTGDMSVDKISDFSFVFNEDGKVEITVSLSESNQKKLSDYMKKNIGKELFLKLGKITFSKTIITDEMEPGEIKFVGTEFLGRNTDERKYDFIFELAKYSVNTQHNGFASFSTEYDAENKQFFGVPFVTSYDEFILEKAKQVYPDILFERPSINNEIIFEFPEDISDRDVEKYLLLSEKIYEACNFDDGAYQNVIFRWGSESDIYYRGFSFRKTNGKMMFSTGNDNIEKAAEKRAFYKKHINK